MSRLLKLGLALVVIFTEQAHRVVLVEAWPTVSYICKNGVLGRLSVQTGLGKTDPNRLVLQVKLKVLIAHGFLGNQCTI